MKFSVEFNATNQEIPVKFGSVQHVQTPGVIGYEIGHGLKVENNVLLVDTAQEVEQDNTLPITSAAVHTTVGNIEILLKTI